jgi:HSP20 family protein
MDRLLVRRHLLDSSAERCGRCQVNGQRLLHLKPRVNIIRDPESEIIRCQVELPGLKKEDLSVTVNSDRLIIAGTRHSPLGEGEKQSNPMFIVREVKYGSFRREVALPQDLQIHEISATLTNGMLDMTWPRVSAHAETSRRIEVSEAQQ